MPPALSSGSHTLTLPCDGQDRRCLVHVPAGVSPSALVLYLHGAGATAEWALEETGWDRTAEAEGFVVALPEALPLDPSLPMRFHRNPTWWNDGSPVSRSANRAVDDLCYLDMLIADLRDRLSIPPEGVFVSGFSNGAAMTFRLAAEGAVPLTAIAPVAGYCWQTDPQLTRPVPTFYLVGRENPLVPIEGGVIRSPWGWSGERPPVQESIDRWSWALAGRRPLVVRLIEGLGHHWPGGRARLSRRLFGPPRPDLLANEWILEFFRSISDPTI